MDVYDKQHSTFYDTRAFASSAKLLPELTSLLDNCLLKLCKAGGIPEDSKEATALKAELYYQFYDPLMQLLNQEVSKVG
jgi:hypothetical protein